MIRNFPQPPPPPPHLSGGAPTATSQHPPAPQHAQQQIPQHQQQLYSKHYHQLQQHNKQLLLNHHHHHHHTLMHHNHTLQQPQPQPQQQPPPPLYNMNSDCSSSTYHIYDQISDLIVIKQQRLAAKLEQKQRRKVILAVALAILLVTAVFFMLLQFIFNALNTSDSAAGNFAAAASGASTAAGGASIVVVSHPFQQQQQQRHYLSSSQQMPPPLLTLPTASNFGEVLQSQQQPILRDAGLVTTTPSAGQPPLPYGAFSSFSATPQASLATSQATLTQHQHQQHSSLPQAPQVHHLSSPPSRSQQQQPAISSGNLQQVPATASSSPASPFQWPASFVLPARRKQPSSAAANGCPKACSNRGKCVEVSNNNLASQSSTLSSRNYYASGQQQQSTSSFYCQCEPGAVGDDCSISVEKTCNDKLDNDNDGLVDCFDSDCCASVACQGSYLCLRGHDPLDILMQKHPPVPPSTFYQRMQFLIEAQTFKNSTTQLNASKASVIRGRVVYAKQGIISVRVEVEAQEKLGVAFTRDNGYFDIMVNGGGDVTLVFTREPFVKHQLTVQVPANEIVIVDPIELKLDAASSGRDATNSVLLQNGTTQSGKTNNDADSTSAQTAATSVASPACSIHDPKLIKPNIYTLPQHKSTTTTLTKKQLLAAAQQQHQVKYLNNNNNNNEHDAKHQHLVNNNNDAGSKYSKAVLISSAGIIRHSIEILGTAPNKNAGNTAAAADNHNSVSLVYVSSKSNEFLSTIDLQLTPSLVYTDELSKANSATASRLMQELKLVHLKVVIEGNLFEQVFEPQANLTFTYGWNRRNVYRQKSYGVSTATVSVGYEYLDCKTIFWTKSQVPLAAYDLPISDIGNQWNLNIHHRYNHRAGILHRGDGQNFNLVAGQSAPLPELNENDEYEIRSPENPNEELVFNKHGLHIATRDVTSSSSTSMMSLSSSTINKYTFTYTVNTSYGQLATISFANGNKISIVRDGSHHNAKLIETAFGGQVKLEISKTGQVHSISLQYMPPQQSDASFVINDTSYQNNVEYSKTSLTYKGFESGLLRQATNDDAVSDSYEFSYDEFGRASKIGYFKLPYASAIVECTSTSAPLDQQQQQFLMLASNNNQSLAAFKRAHQLNQQPGGNNQRCAELVID